MIVHNVINVINVIEAARPIPLKAKRDLVSYVNHGGVAIVFRRRGVSIDKINVTLKVSTFEYLCCRVISKGATIILATNYRPGSVPSTATFLKEFSTFVELLATFFILLTIVGDINLHLHQIDDVNRAVECHCANV